MKTENERIDELWAAMKENLARTQTARAAKEITRVSSKDDAMFRGAIRVGTASYGSATVCVSRDLYAECGISLTKDQLIEVSAHAMAAAMELEEQAAKKSEEERLNELDAAA